MPSQSKSVTLRIAAIIAAAVIATIAMVVWDFHIHRASKLPVQGITQNKGTPSNAGLQATDAMVRIPQLSPGVGCAKVNDILGRPVAKDQYGATWQTNDFKISAGTDRDCVLANIGVTVSPGHTAMTKDGVVLGKSTVADVERIFKSRIVPGGESIDAPEGEWEVNVELLPTSEFPYKEIYSTFLHQKPSERNKVEEKDPVLSDFRNLPVLFYSVDNLQSEPPRQ